MPSLLMLPTTSDVNRRSRPRLLTDAPWNQCRIGRLWCPVWAFALNRQRLRPGVLRAIAQHISGTRVVDQ
jgi:hypothetical protein